MRFSTRFYREISEKEWNKLPTTIDPHAYQCVFMPEKSTSDIFTLRQITEKAWE